MTEEIKRKGAWILEHGLVILQAATVLVLVTIYVANNASRSAQASADIVLVNARLDRLFDKLDEINKSLPVLAEKVHAIEEAVTTSRGAFASLDLRLRLIEANEAANHADINAIKPNPRHIVP